LPLIGFTACCFGITGPPVLEGTYTGLRGARSALEPVINGAIVNAALHKCCGNLTLARDLFRGFLSATGTPDKAFQWVRCNGHLVDLSVVDAEKAARIHLSSARHILRHHTHHDRAAPDI